MISFFKDIEKNEMNDNYSYSKIAALLIHTAKIDEAYKEKEENIIRVQQTWKLLGIKEDWRILKASDIQLDMNSSEEMLAFRDLLSERERLAIDPVQDRLNRSATWWSNMNA